MERIFDPGRDIILALSTAMISDDSKFLKGSNANPNKQMIGWRLMSREYNSLLQNKSWELVDRPRKCQHHWKPLGLCHKEERCYSTCKAQG